MKISVIDKNGSGIALQFARALGARVEGRFFHIPEDKGEGYMTGFNWANRELRMMVQNYYLKEEVVLERTNELEEDQDDIIFSLSGIFNSFVKQEKQLMAQPANVFICMHAVSSQLTMPSNTSFRSITIAASRRYLRQLFGNIPHPVVVSILESKENFAFETGISPEMIKTGSEIIHPPVTENLESHYCKLKCEELLCYIFSLLAQRDPLPTSGMHMDDIKAIYAIKLRL